MSVRNQIVHRPKTTNFPSALNGGSNTWAVSLNLSEGVADQVTAIHNTGVVGSGNDTRPNNTAFAPRIICY